MKFADFICFDSIQVGIESTNKPGIIQELAQSLMTANKFPQSELDSIVKAILKREELGSTGIGRGLAVPHTKHPSVSKLVGTVAISPGGIEFESLDGEKVQLLFLLISSPDRPGDHLRALEYISRQLRDERFCSALKQTKNVDEVKQLLLRADESQH
jgi:mannitol/fructose-specific phosphotransferase system IIA component (Ntr-type)